MFNVGGGELLVIFLIALVVLGPDKLPGAARQAGKYMSEFRRISQGFQQELRDAVKEAVPDLDGPAPTMKPVDRAVILDPDAPTTARTASTGAAGNGTGAVQDAVPTTSFPTDPDAPTNGTGNGNGSSSGSGNGAASRTEKQRTVHSKSIKVDGPPGSFS
jgi:sec-independent protein translocase protein TatB